MVDIWCCNDGLGAERRLAEPEVVMKNRLRELRAAKGWSQAALADVADVSRQTVNALEKGRYDPSLPLAFKLAAIFETTIEDVFHPEADDVAV